MGWRPIDSAPRDGTWIDLWVDQHRVANVFFKDGNWRTYSHSVRCVPRYIIWTELNPTHWQPLPEPPEAMAATRGGAASSGQGNSTEQSHNRSSLTGTGAQ